MIHNAPFTTQKWKGGWIMRRRHIVIAVVVFVLFSVWVLALSEYAGDTEPINPPGSTSSYTLNDIYNRLNDGTAGSQSTFTEPTAGPGTPTMHTLNEIMDLMRSTYTRVPKTGQTMSYRAGDDGDYGLGVLPEIEPTAGVEGAYTVYGWGGTRFTDNGDGTVTDNLTGLMWTTNANHGAVLWDAAIDYCNSYSLAGYDDWRLPNINELHSLIDLSQSDPALPVGHPFTGVLSEGYWSSTTSEGFPDLAWETSLINGYMNHVYKDLIYYVWPVRGGQ